MLKENSTQCKVKNCENKFYAKTGMFANYCEKHRMQVMRNGKILKRTIFDPNKIIDCGGYYEIVLYSGRSEQKEVARAKIDKDDIGKVKMYKWFLDDGFYVSNRKKRIHQLILQKKEGFVIDHKNKNKLDNRKYNLRYATKSQNAMNKIVKGYCWHKTIGKWIVKITLNKKEIFIGSFHNEQDAIKARRNAELKYFGEFATIC